MVSLKYQMTKCRRGELKYFGYGVIVLSLFLEKVPLMRPQVPLSRLDVEYPKMSRWVDSMAFHGGGGGPSVTYKKKNFHWLRSQILMIKDYSYTGTEFCKDHDLPLLKRGERDDRCQG